MGYHRADEILIEERPDELLLVLSSGDIVRAGQKGKIGILMGIEGIAKWVMGETDILRMLYRSGVRLVGITHVKGAANPRSSRGRASTRRQKPG